MLNEINTDYKVDMVYDINSKIIKYIFHGTPFCGFIVYNDFAREKKILELGKEKGSTVVLRNGVLHDLHNRSDCAGNALYCFLWDDQFPVLYYTGSSTNLTTRIYWHTTGRGGKKTNVYPEDKHGIKLGWKQIVILTDTSKFFNKKTIMIPETQTIKILQNNVYFRGNSMLSSLEQSWNIDEDSSHYINVFMYYWKEMLKISGYPIFNISVIRETNKDPKKLIGVYDGLVAHFTVLDDGQVVTEKGSEFSTPENAQTSKVRTDPERQLKEPFFIDGGLEKVIIEGHGKIKSKVVAKRSIILGNRAKTADAACCSRVGPTSDYLKIAI